MPRIRTIKPEFWVDEKIVQLPYDVRLLFIGLWNLADDAGRLKYRPDKLKYQLFPADKINLIPCIELLADKDLITIYYDTEEDDEFIQILKFNEHQKISHPTESRIPSANIYKKKMILLDERRLLAERYGCKPGKEAIANCYFCGLEGVIHWWVKRSGSPSYWVTFGGLEIDHLEPEVKGGKQNDNLILSCRKCNRKRGTKDPIVFLEDSGKLPKIPEDSENNPSEGRGGEGKGNT